MRTTRSEVEKILESDDVARAALGRGLLNMSAYAKTIHKHVEKQLFKSIKTPSVVMALSRIGKNLQIQQDKIEEADVHDVSMKSNLVEISFSASNNPTKTLLDIQRKFIDRKQGFLTVTSGVRETTIIADQSLAEEIVNSTKEYEPLLKLSNLCAITLQLGRDAITIPNITFAILRKLAMRNINLVEVVSTYTEVTLVVASRDAAEVVSLFQ